MERNVFGDGHRYQVDAGPGLPCLGELGPPGAVPDGDDDSSLQISGMDKLFSNLFNSVLTQGPGGASSLFGGSGGPPPGMPLRTQDTDKTNDSESSDESESDSDGEDDDCGHANCHISNSDPRWDVVNKLLESHLNLTRVVDELFKSKSPVDDLPELVD